jgi:hypothetical protein
MTTRDLGNDRAENGVSRLLIMADIIKKSDAAEMDIRIKTDEEPPTN